MDGEKNFTFTGYNKNLKGVSRTLRKNMTRQEKHLWYDFLKDYPIRFHTQRPIGTYIADFYCSKVKLVIELDGNQHYSEDGKKYDENRTSVFNDYGVEVIRFSNNEVDKNFEGVCMEIDRAVSEKMKNKSLP